MRTYIWEALVGELGREDDLVALAWVLLKPGAEEVFVVAVDVGGVPEELASGVGGVEDGEALRVRFGGAVEGGEAHGAEAEGGDLGTVLA